MAKVDKMSEPLRVRKGKIIVMLQQAGIIALYADDEIIEKIGRYGHVEEIESTPGRFRLTVDQRYEFQDVVDYINELIELG